MPQVRYELAVGPEILVPLGWRACDLPLIPMSASRPSPSPLGIAQILGWGTSFYFPAVLAGPIVADTGWSLFW